MGSVVDMSRHILCVEDDKTFADILIRHLQQAGFEVTHAMNGEDGGKRARSEQPDAILLDIGLPQKDGFTLLEELKSDAETSKIPVFMLTRLSTREDLERCFRLGCTDYLIKTQQHPADVVRRLKKHFGLDKG